MPVEIETFLKILMLITHVSNFVLILCESCPRCDFLPQNFCVMCHIVLRLFDAYIDFNKIKTFHLKLKGAILINQNSINVLITTYEQVRLRNMQTSQLFIRTIVSAVAVEVRSAYFL